METRWLREHADELIETRMEYRDGGPWLVGLCPRCWEPVAVRASPDEPPARVTCENGHVLRVKSTHSWETLRHAA